MSSDRTMLGCTSTSTTFNDLWRFDLERRKWVRPLATGIWAHVSVRFLNTRFHLWVLGFGPYV